MTRRFPFGGDAALLLCAMVWGTTFLVTKQAVAHATPIAFVAARFLLAAAVLAPFALKDGLKPLWRARYWGLGIGVLIAGGFGLQTWALTRIGPSRSAFLTSFYVFFTVLIEWVVLRRRPGWPVAIGAVLAVVGVGVMTGAGLGEPVAAGDAATLLCALVFAGQMVALSQALRRFGSKQILLLEIATCGLLSVPGAFLFDRPPHVAWNGTVLFAVAYLGVVATVLVLGLQNYGQARTTASRAGVMFSSEPVWTAIFSALVLGDRLSAREWSGASLVMVGLLIAMAVPPLLASREPAGADARHTSTDPV